MILKYLFLLPLSKLYGSIVAIRNFLFKIKILKSHKFNVPVISVGNLSVGGTGKTPHIEYLINLLSQNNSIAVLSRGYKRKTKGFRIAKNDDSSEKIGDEPRQIKRKFPAICVAVDEDRVNGINRIMSENPSLSVVLLDDAFQHRYVKPGVSILLTDYSKLFYNDHLLPLGRLREKPEEKKRADIIVVTKVPDNVSSMQCKLIMENIQPFDYQTVYFSSLKYGNLIPVAEDKKEQSDEITLNETFKSDKYSVLLITGIAQPALIKEYLQKFSYKFNHLQFSDHHNFSQKDIFRIVLEYEKLKTGGNEQLIIVTTEKDAVRLIDNSKIKMEQNLINQLYYLPIEVKFIEDTGKQFDKKIIEYVTKNKRNNGFPKVTF